MHVVKVPDIWNHGNMNTARAARRADVSENDPPKLTYVIGRLDRLQAFVEGGPLDDEEG